MTVAIARAFKPVEADLWGSKFETVDHTRGTLKKATKINAEVERLKVLLGEDEEGDIGDQLVEKVGEGLDLRLQAIAGGKKKPSTILKAKWKAEDLSLRQLFGFIGELGLTQMLAEATDGEDDEDEGGSDRPS